MTDDSFNRAGRWLGLRLLIPCLLGLILIPMIAHAAGLTCDLCGKPIIGKYFVYQKGNARIIVCADCDKNNAHCALCGVPVPGTNPKAQNVLCRDCKKNAHYCEVCGELITGTVYRTSKGHEYCHRCWETAPRCDGCNDLLRPGDWHRDHGYRLCSDCWKTLPRCAGCGKPIIGEYYTFTGFPGKYCFDCRYGTPACASCGRPTGPDGVHIAEHLVLCKECARTAILTRDDLIRLSRDVRRRLNQRLQMDIQHDIQWELSTKLKIERAVGGPYREAGLFIQSGDMYTIRILKGLARSVCIETIAHELGHAWQAEHLPGMTRRMEREGFAEWVAAKIIEDYGFKGLLEKLEARRDVYGQGYRWMKSLERIYGEAGVLERLKQKD